MNQLNLYSLNSEEFFLLLKEKCPIIFRDGSISYVECSAGWFKLIFDLSIQIEDIVNKIIAPPEDCIPIVVQIKEKFGGLRYYINQSPSDEIDELIKDAESESYNICEICGKFGEKRPGGWIKTLCDEHFKV